MSWRSGSKLFIEIWPSVRENIPDRQLRIEFTAELLRPYGENDMGTWDVEDVHPDIRAALRLAEIGVAEPDWYDEEEGAQTAGAILSERHL